VARSDGVVLVKRLIFLTNRPTAHLLMVHAAFTKAGNSPLMHFLWKATTQENRCLALRFACVRFLNIFYSTDNQIEIRVEDAPRWHRPVVVPKIAHSPFVLMITLRADLLP